MKKLLYIMVMTAALTGCRTTEANYRAAYEKAKNHRNEWNGIDGTVYDAIRREAAPARMTIDGVSIPAKTVRVKAEDTRETVKKGGRYLIAAQFKQIFNARSMRDRLKTMGWPDATILSTAEPLYYVAASAPDSDAGVVADFKRLSAEPPMTLGEDFPWLLIVAQ